MFRSALSALVVCSLIALAGCSGGDDDKSSSPPAKSSEGTAPSEKSSIGPQCTAYFACCDEVAKSQPSLAGSCDSSRTSADDAVAKGSSTDDLESSCKQALGMLQNSGYCK